MVRSAAFKSSVSSASTVRSVVADIRLEDSTVAGVAFVLAVARLRAFHEFLYNGLLYDPNYQSVVNVQFLMQQLKSHLIMARERHCYLGK
ncbi:unnamed protein product [Gongylonema pulchrum]|uniref:RUN domain-containing protein n=1 Tax=Gongylonema pulchrum TaxID=637853 RepID=A0A183EG08_9BILA|nr:unnamed protein product [Gongylonema pulchrum]